MGGHSSPARPALSRATHSWPVAEFLLPPPSLPGPLSLPPAWLQDTPHCLSPSPCPHPPFLPSHPKKPTQSSFLFCPQNALHSQTHRPQAQSSSTALPPSLLFLSLGMVNSSSYGRLKGGR
ncbi:unnamed protein product [Pipistrellus nathusii]|uniref:Uncharacterized protein n=1 Tax=Pipistrellus nathusii TaxID=59473 RepID=A0ABN9ZH24_PIPNA